MAPLLPALLALALPTMPAAAARTFTIGEVRSLSVEILAERVLGAAGELVREVSRPPTEPFPGQTAGLRSLDFASAPRASRSPGLCVADAIFVSFTPAPGTREGDPDPPSVIARLSTGQFYRIVSDPSPLPDEWNEDYERRLSALCATAAGHVIRQPGETRSGFFNGSNGSSGFWETHAAVAAQALDQIIRRARSGVLQQIECSPDTWIRDDSLCADPRALLAAIDPSNLSYVQFDSCRFRREMRCINLSFPRWVDELGSQRQMAISIETDQPASSQDIRVGEIRTIRIGGHTIVY